MADFQLYVGYRQTSSWSLRGWLLMRKAGADFEETLIRYRMAEGKARLSAISPTARVPLLVDRRGGGKIGIWESLAIGEYLAELFPAARLWPEDATARACARSVSTEMQSSFLSLREQMPMALLERRQKPDNAEVNADIARVTDIWRDCRNRFGEAGGGPFLFGRFTIADAMYAPVVSRFRTYSVAVDPIGDAYMAAILNDPDVQAWFEQAKRDPEPEPL